MPIDFYYLVPSLPCRAVQMTAAAVGVDLNLKIVDVLNGEQLKPEYIKMNPQHTVPTINDNGFVLWESRAIMGYLADKYAKNDSLYPKDAKARALVNQKLYFDIGTLHQSFADYYFNVIFKNAPEDPVKYEKMTDAFKFLDKFLEGKNYVATDHLTIADIAIVGTVSNFEVVNYDFSDFKNVSRWYKKMQSEIPKYNETNGVGAKAFKAFVDRRLKK